MAGGKGCSSTGASAVDYEGNTIMRCLFYILVLSSLLLSGCGCGCGCSDDSEEQTESAGIEYTGPETPISGAYNAIGEASDAVDAANDRVHQMEEILEGD